MTLQDKRKALLNILYIKEAIDDVDVDNITEEYLCGYITNTAIRFSGVEMDNELKDKIVDTLNGIKNLSNRLTHKEIRSAILGLIGDIERYEDEVLE